MDQTFPLRFAYCKQSKLDGGKTWNEASLTARIKCAIAHFIDSLDIHIYLYGSVCDLNR